jgi:hypothetical protein
MFHKGYIPTEEHRRHLSESRKGIIFTEEHIRNLSLSHLGKKQSPKTIEKRRLKLLGRKQSQKEIEKRVLGMIGMKWSPEALKNHVGTTGHKTSEETKRKLSIALKGRKMSEEFKMKMRMRIGKLSASWKGGISPINERIRKRIEYKEWRTAVFERDNYTCQICGICGGRLNADHIKPFSLFPELRFELSNGRTLCEDCHKKTDTWGNRVSNYFKGTGVLNV